MPLIWIETTQLRPFVGHGLDFFSEEDKSADTLAAVVRAFDWLHRGDPDGTEVEIRPPDATYDADYLDSVRFEIETFLCNAVRFTAQLTPLAPRLYMHVNG